MEMPSLSACSSRNDPVPAAQALFISKSTMTPLSMLIYLESWPPISKMVSTSGSISIAASAWAVISFRTRSAPMKVGRQVTSRAGCSHADDLDHVPDLFTDLGESSFDRFKRPALRS